MIGGLKAIFHDLRTEGDTAAFSVVQVATCALMLKAAAADDEFSDDERKMIESRMADHFDLRPRHAAQLIDEALDVLSGRQGLYAFSMVLNDALDAAQRKALLEMVWEIMYADGSLHEYEARLMRRIGPILDIEESVNDEIHAAVRARIGP